MGPSVAGLLHEGLVLLGVVGGPLFGALLVSGLAVGVLQATTQVNDPAVGFVPRLAVAVVVCLLLGGWMVERLAAFFASAIQRMPGVMS